jgi:hypothetical protein
VTVLHSGPTRGYSDNWERAFGANPKRKSTVKTARKKAAPKKRASTAKKAAVVKKKATATRKKAAAKKSKRK